MMVAIFFSEGSLVCRGTMSVEAIMLTKNDLSFKPKMCLGKKYYGLLGRKDGSRA